MNSIVATFVLSLMVFCQKAAANQPFDEIELTSYDYDDTARQLSGLNDTNTAFALGMSVLVLMVIPLAVMYFFSASQSSRRYDQTQNQEYYDTHYSNRYAR